MLLGEFHNRFNIYRLAVEMNRDNRLGARRERGFELAGVEREKVRLDVNQNRSRACHLNRRHGRDRRMRDGDYFIAVTNAAGDQGQMKCFRSTSDTDSMSGADVRGKLSFERSDLFALDIPTLLQHLGDRRINLRLVGKILGLWIATENHPNT